MANFYLVTVGPAVAHLVPCGFDFVPVEGAGAAAVGCNDECDDGRCDGYGGGHPCERLLDVLPCFGECGVGCYEALDGGFFFEWMHWRGCLATPPFVVPVPFSWLPGWRRMGSCLQSFG